MTTETPPTRSASPNTPGGLRGVPALLLGALLLTSACGTTPPTRWFVLVPSAPVPAQWQRPDLSVEVEPVSLPASLRRQQLVTRIGQHELRLADFERWAEPLEDNLGAVLTEDLGRLLGSQQVWSTADRGPDRPAWRVAVEVLRLDGGPGDELALVSRWVLRDGSGGVHTTGRTRHVEPLADGEPETFVRSLNLCVGALARDLAAAVVGAAASP